MADNTELSAGGPFHNLTRKLANAEDAETAIALYKEAEKMKRQLEEIQASARAGSRGYAEERDRGAGDTGRPRRLGPGDGQVSHRIEEQEKKTESDRTSPRRINGPAQNVPKDIPLAYI